MSETARGSLSAAVDVAIASAAAPATATEPRTRREGQTLIGYAASDVTPSALRPFRPDGRVLKSELPAVSNEQWTDFVFAMKVGDLGAVSPSHGLGMFDIRYKRLVDLGLATNLRYRRDPATNRSVQLADWLPPMTEQAFLASAGEQYKVFVRLMRSFARELYTGKLKLPASVSVSGALAILHRGGRGALAKWQTDQFESTRELVARTNGVF